MDAVGNDGWLEMRCDNGSIAELAVSIGRSTDVLAPAGATIVTVRDRFIMRNETGIDFDFTERVYDVNFYSFLDILSKLGGLRASILPILKYCMPLLTLHFLWKLSGIIDNAMHNNQQNELLKLLKTARKQFLQIE